MLSRREFIVLLGGAAAWPTAGRAESDGVRRIGMLLALHKKRVNMGQILEMYPYSVKGGDYHEMGDPGRPHAIGSVGHTS
jgi:hypothetical protein